MIHMTESFGGDTHPDRFGFLCRCGHRETGFPTRYQARRAGDAHLVDANAVDPWEVQEA